MTFEAELNQAPTVAELDDMVDRVLLTPRQVREAQAAIVDRVYETYNTMVALRLAGIAVSGSVTVQEDPVLTLTWDSENYSKFRVRFADAELIECVLYNRSYWTTSPRFHDPRALAAFLRAILRLEAWLRTEIVRVCKALLEDPGFTVDREWVLHLIEAREER